MQLYFLILLKLENFGDEIISFSTWKFDLKEEMSQAAMSALVCFRVSLRYIEHIFSPKFICFPVNLEERSKNSLVM